jgi:peptidoglycan biosynthesis protein MviN/MurJ (putative lipid II flippase)
MLNILVNLFVIRIFGTEGAAWVAFGTQTLFALFLTYLAARRTGIDLHMGDLKYYIALMLITVLIFQWITM